MRSYFCSNKGPRRRNNLRGKLKICDSQNEFSIMLMIWEVHSLLTLNKISCFGSILDDMNCPQQNKFLWIVAIGKCLGELNSSLYHGSLKSGSAGGCNAAP